MVVGLALLLLSLSAFVAGSPRLPRRAPAPGIARVEA